MLVGIVLMILKVVALNDKSITYTTREKVLQFGHADATQKTEKPSPCHFPSLDLACSWNWIVET